MRVLELSGVSFFYEKRQILKDISFSVRAGGVFCLLGPNGCGKTTLQRCILGLNRHDGGTLNIHGRPIEDYKPREMARTLSYVPQSHEKTFPYRTIDVVLMGRSHAHEKFSSPGSEDEAIALGALEKVGMAGFAERRYTELSGGELQLVMIARALCQNASVMLLDEPTSHLDFKNEIVLLEVLAGLVIQSGLTLLIASHSLNHPFFFESEGINTEIALMEKGEIKQIGKPGKVCDEITMRNIFGIETRLKSHNESGKDRYYMISWKES